jgi:hypothetical protein
MKDKNDSIFYLNLKGRKGRVNIELFLDIVKE